MARKLIKDLQPVTTYAIQVRAVSPDAVGKWSRKFNVTTIDDDVLPQVPTGISWVPVGDSFHGEWNKVTQNTLGENINVERYEVELTGNPGAIVKYSSVPQVTEGNTVTFDFTYLKNIARFGTAKKDVSFRVRAINKRGKKSDWSASYSANNDAPAAPGGLTATPGYEEIALSWNAVSADDLSGYRLYLSTTGINGSYSRIYQGNSLNYTYSTTNYSTDHYFYVTAYDTFGIESVPSAKAGPVRPNSSFIVDTTPPSVPTGLAVSLSRTGSIASANLSWTFDETATSNKDIQGFAIKWYKTGAASNFSIANATKDARTLNIPLPEPFADYQFQIASIDYVANYSAWSSAVTLTGSIAGAPPQVTGVNATAALDNIQLSWTQSTAADVQYGGYYEVQVATNSGFTTGLLTYQTGNTNISVSGLNHDTQYFFRVRAVDVTGTAGPYSTTDNRTTTGFAPSNPSDGLPPTSSPAATLTPGIGLLFVSWSPVTNADLVTYEVHISTTSTFNPTLGAATKVAETPGTTVTLTKDAAGAALSYSTPYYVRIIAKDRDTTSGNAPAAGTVSAGVSPRKAGTGDIVTIIADQIATGSLGAAVITIASGGVIQSTGYSAGVSGFKISDTVVDIRSGTVGFNTLAAGTLSTTGLTIGAGGSITVDSTGEIRSNTYSAGTTGWKISNSGIELNDANSKVKAAAIIGGTFTGGNFIVGSGGTIQSSNYNTTNQTGWSLGYTGLTIYGGTIQGAGVYTNSLTSLTNDSVTGQPLFSINAGGYAQLAGAHIIGPTVLGQSASTSHYIQSYNFNSSTNTGWQIDAAGNATIHNLQIGTAAAGMNFSWSGSGYSIFKLRATHKLYAYDDSYLNVSTNTLSLVSNGGVGGHLETAGDIFTGRYLYTDTIYPNLGANVTIGAGGLVLSGGNLNMSTYNINNVNALGVTTINGGPTINGNPTWTSAGTGGTANVNWNNGKMQPVTSSRRYKDNIKDYIVDLDSVYELVPRKYTRISDGKPEIGFIAEEALDAGLDDWVMYDDEGEVDSFDYFKWVVALQAVVVAQKSTIDDLTARVESLEA